VESVDEKLRRYKNEQQQDDKNSVELRIKWTKTTWKTFEFETDEDETGL
jgi:hypothetical protein